MNRKIATFRYLLWTLGLLPAALLIEIIVGLPFFVTAYSFHWVNRATGILVFWFYWVVIVLVGMIFNVIDLDFSNASPSDCFCKMIGYSAISSAFFCMILCCDMMLEKVSPNYDFWHNLYCVILTISIPANVILEIVFVILFVMTARRDFRESKT